MDNERKVSGGFKKYLQTELEFWKNEGMIEPGQAEKIGSLYRLDDHKKRMANNLFYAIYLIAAVLIATGIISFVAANWSGIPKFAKLVILFSAMIGAHGVGFYLWQVRSSASRLGHVLVVLGTLMFGANIGLIAQMYHIDGHFSNAAMVWAVGAAVMAYLTGSSPNMFIAIVISFAGYVTGIERAFWSSMYNPFVLYPLIAAVVFSVYCLWKRSAFLLSLAGFAVGLSSIISVASRFDLYGTVIAACILSIFYCSAASLLSLYEKYKACAVGLLFWAVAFLLPFVYFLTFNEIAREVIYNINAEKIQNSISNVVPFAVFGILAIVFFTAAFVKGAGKSLFGKIAIVTTLMAIILTGFSVYINCTDWQIPLVIGANLIWLIGGCYCISDGVRYSNRALFWLGIIMMGLLIISRALEYETHLLTKAAAFAGSGVALIIGGIVFEKMAQKRRTGNA